MKYIAPFQWIILVNSIWFSSAHSENLLDIYRLAQKQDAQFQAAQARYRAANELPKQARSVWLPGLSAQAGYTQSDTDVNNQIAARAVNIGGNMQTFNNSQQGKSKSTAYRYSATIEQSIFSLAAIHGSRQINSLHKQRMAEFEIAKQQFLMRVANYYFSVLRNQANLLSAYAEKEAILQQFDQIKKRFENGLASFSEMQEARAAYDLSIANSLSHKANLGRSYESLRTISGVISPLLADLTTDFMPQIPEPHNNKHWESMSQKYSPAIKQAYYAVEVAQHNANVKKYAFAPIINGSISYNRNESNGEEIGTSFDNYSQGWASRINLSIPLFGNGRISADRRQAFQEYLAATNNYQHLQRETARLVHSHYLNLEIGIARINAFAQAVSSAKDAQKAIQSGYKAGTRDIVDVLNAQRSLSQAERDYANARYDFLVNTLRLKQQAGVLNEKDLSTLNEWLVLPEPA